MGELEQTIGMAVKKVSEKMQVKQILSGRATSVGQFSCTVEREGSPTLFDVRLNAIDDSLESFLTVYPAEGSEVLVAVIENMKTEAVVIRCSEIQKISAKIGNTELNLDTSGFQFSRSGQNLQEVLSDLIAEVQKIVVVIGTTPNVVKLEEIKTNLKKILK